MSAKAQCPQDSRCEGKGQKVQHLCQGQETPSPRLTLDDLIPSQDSGDVRHHFLVSKVGREGFGGGRKSPRGANRGAVPVTWKTIKGDHAYQRIRVLNSKISSSPNSLRESQLRITSEKLSEVFSANAVDCNPPLTSRSTESVKNKDPYQSFHKKASWR